MAAKTNAEAAAPRRYDIFNPSPTTPRRLYDGIKNIAPIDIAPGGVAYDTPLAAHIAEDILADAEKAEALGDRTQLQLKPAGAPPPRRAAPAPHPVKPPEPQEPQEPQAS